MPLKTVKAPSSPAMSRMDQEEAGPAVASAWYSSTAASSGKFIRAPPFTGSTTAFSTLLDLKGAEAQDAHHILSLMESDFFPFRTVAERFHLIDSPTTTVYLPLEEGAGLVELLRSGQYSRTLYRRLGQYGVSVYPQHLAALEQAGALEHLEDGSVVLRDIGLYTQTTGLTLEPSGGNALFIG